MQGLTQGFRETISHPARFADFSKLSDRIFELKAEVCQRFCGYFLDNGSTMARQWLDNGSTMARQWLDNGSVIDSHYRGSIEVQDLLRQINMEPDAS
jgi:hypothetical protein